MSDGDRRGHGRIHGLEVEPITRVASKQSLNIYRHHGAAAFWENSVLCAPLSASLRWVGSRSLLCADASEAIISLLVHRKREAPMLPHVFRQEERKARHGIRVVKCVSALPLDVFVRLTAAHLSLLHPAHLCRQPKLAFFPSDGHLPHVCVGDEYSFAEVFACFSLACFFVCARLVG